MAALANYLYRALFLLGLAIAPRRVFSPDPATPKSIAIALLIPLVAFGVLLAGAYYLRKRVESREARIAAGLIWVSVAASIAGAIYFTGPNAPLARGAAPMALVVWPTLAALAATLAGQYLGTNWKHRRTAAAAAVLAGGIFVHAGGATKAADTTEMWTIALDADPANETAFDQVTRPLLAQGKLDDVNRRAAACLRVSPTACSCLVARVAAAQKKADAEKAVTAGAEAAKACPYVTAARAAYAEALLVAGRLDEAAQQADEALLLDDDPPRAHAAKATVLLAQGKMTEAEAEAQKATGSSGGSRDAKLLIVNIAINNKELDRAEQLLKEMLAQNPKDADVLYDLALVADVRDKYNDARNGYLATLRVDPTYKNARLNLARLTYRKGVIDEAKNHARKFEQMAPNDPALPGLMKMIFGDGPRAPAPTP